MPVNDLREWLARVDEIGDLTRVDGADPNLEIGAITTIEGLSPDGGHPLQKAWQEVNTPQCGYCQPGQIMSAAALLRKTPRPSDQEIDAALAGNLCRCGSYVKILDSMHEAIARLRSG